MIPQTDSELFNRKSFTQSHEQPQPSAQQQQHASQEQEPEGQIRTISERYSAVYAPRVHLPKPTNGIFSRENTATLARANQHTLMFQLKILNNI